MTHKNIIRMESVISADLLNWMEAFIQDRQSTLLSGKTIGWHRTSLPHFMKFCGRLGIDIV